MHTKKDGCAIKRCCVLPGPFFFVRFYHSHSPISLQYFGWFISPLIWRAVAGHHRGKRANPPFCLFHPSCQPCVKWCCYGWYTLGSSQAACRTGLYGPRAEASHSHNTHTERNVSPAFCHPSLIFVRHARPACVRSCGNGCSVLCADADCSLSLSTWFVCLYFRVPVKRQPLLPFPSSSSLLFSFSSSSSIVWMLYALYALCHPWLHIPFQCTTHTSLYTHIYTHTYYALDFVQYHSLFIAHLFFAIAWLPFEFEYEFIFPTETI